MKATSENVFKKIVCIVLSLILTFVPLGVMAGSTDGSGNYLYVQSNDYGVIAPDAQATTPGAILAPRLGLRVNFDPNGGVTAEGQAYRTTTTGTAASGTIGAGNMPHPPHNEGFWFSHWNLNQNADNNNNNVFTGTSQVTAANAPLTVYAQWGYRVEFVCDYVLLPNLTGDPNNAAHFAPRIGLVDRSVNETPGIVWPNNPTRPGFVFAGWINPHEVGYFDGDRPITRTITLFATWELAPILTVIFDPTGGIQNPPGGQLQDGHVNTREARQGLSISTSSIAPHNLNQGILFPRSAPAVQARPGMTFANWRTGSHGTGSHFAPAGAATSNFAMNAIQQDMTVRAHWVYRVTFNPNGGSAFNPNTDGMRDIPIRVENGTIATDGIAATNTAGNWRTLPSTPTRSNSGGFRFEFIGWFDTQHPPDPEDLYSGYQFTVNSIVNESKTVWARWRPVEIPVAPPPDQIPVTFNTTEGQFVNGDTIAVRYVNENSNILNTPGVSMPGIPIRPNYIFMGWYPELNVHSGRFGNVTIVTEERTVYARWLPYAVVTFNANGGQFTGGGGNTTVIRNVAIGYTFAQMQSVWLSAVGVGSFYNLTTSTFTTSPRAGFTRAATSLVSGTHTWSSSADGRGAAFNASTVITESRTVYAEWLVNITFNRNHTQGAGEATVPRRALLNDSFRSAQLNPLRSRAAHMGNFTMPTIETSPSPAWLSHWTSLNRLEWAFIGWNTRADGEGTWFYSDTVITGPMTLFAIWQRGVAFLPGHAPANVIHPDNAYRDVVESEYFQPGTTILRGTSIGSAMPPNPVWPGHYFSHWNSHSDGTGVTYGPSEPEVWQSRTLFAVWLAEVIFDVNGGVLVGDRYIAQVVVGTPLGQAIIPDPTRDGYWAFAGWNTRRDGTGYMFTAASPVVPSNMTLYARWIPTNNLYEKRIFNEPELALGEEVFGQTPNDWHPLGENLTVSHGIREGYIFTHWTVAGTTVTTLANNDLTFLMPGNTVDIVAHWEAIPPNYYPIFVINGGAGYYADPNLAAAGTQISISAGTPPEGFMFAGWTTETEGVSLASYDSAQTYFTMVNSAVTVTANWEPLPPGYYSIVVINGGVGYYANPSHATAGTLISINAGTPPEGYTFIGWTTETEGVSLASYSSLQTYFTMVNSTVTVVANWDPIPEDYFSIIVINGGVGYYANPNLARAGTEIALYAGTPPQGYFFREWTTDTTGVNIAPITASQAYFTMVNSNVTVTANWEPIPPGYFLITIIDGGSGHFANPNPARADQLITLYAGIPHEGYVFYNWTPNTEGITIANATSYNNATFNMIAESVTVTANWVREEETPPLPPQPPLPPPQQPLPPPQQPLPPPQQPLPPSPPGGNAPQTQPSTRRPRNAVTRIPGVATTTPIPAYSPTEAPANIVETTIPPPTTPPPLIRDVHIAYVFGFPDGTFRPSSSLTRAEMSALLFNLIDYDGKYSPHWASMNRFSDVNAGRWYTQAINYMAGTGILSGFPDGTFRPNQPMTRAELTTAMSLFFDITTGTNPFTDIHGHWAYAHINSAFNKGWISGYGDNTFRPNNPITRAETVIIVNSALGRVPNPITINYHIPNTVFPDLPQNHWAYYEIMEAAIKHEHMFEGDLEIWIRVDLP